MRRSLLSIFLLVLFTAPSISQSSLDLFTVSGRIATAQPYDSLFQNKASESGVLVNVKIPIPLGERAIWYNDLTYSYGGVSNNETVVAEIANPLTLHGFILQTGYIRKFDDDKSIQLLLVPRFMTDFEDVNSKNWQLGAIGLFQKKYHENLMMRFGLLYNQELFGPLLTPLVHLDWTIGSRWSIVGMLPIFAKVNYHASENTTIGFSHFGLTTTFRLGNIAYRDDYIERTSIDLTLFLRQRIAGNIHLEGRVGYAINRKYRQFAEDEKLDLRIIIFNIGDNRIQKNVNFQDGLIASVRVVYNLPL